MLGKFRVESARVSKDESSIIFEGISEDGQRYFFKSEEIVTLDGMPVSRLASIYNLNIKGEDVSAGKRRGRKPRGQAQGHIVQALQVVSQPIPQSSSQSVEAS